MKHLPLTGLMLVLAMSASALAAPDEPLYMMTGDASAIWVIRAHPQQDVFDVIGRPAGGKWTWVNHALGGRPSAAASSEGLLHVFLPKSGQAEPFTDCMRYDFAAHIATPQPRVPGQVVAACQIVQPAYSTQSGPASLMVVALQNQPASTKPASATDTAPGNSATSAAADQAGSNKRLTLLMNTAQGWSEVAVLEDAVITPSTRFQVASLDDRTYLLIQDESRTRLLCYSQDQWLDVPLPGWTEPVHIASMIALPQKLIIAFTGPAADGDAAPISLAIADIGRQTPPPSTQAEIAQSPPSTQATQATAAQISFAIQPVTQQGQALSVSSKAQPQLARLGEQLVILWDSEAGLQWASCRSDGEIISQEELAIFREAPAAMNGQRIIQYFFWIVLILIFIPMVIVRPTTPPKPFVMGEGIVVANLLKRLAAGIIDFLPFNLLAGILFPLPQKTWADMLALVRESRMPDNAAYGVVFALSLYAAYCAIMEFKYSATVGKMVFHLAVIGDEGKRPDLRSIFLRNVMKIAELVPPGLPLLLLVPLLNRNRQRLGDILARTAVIDVRKSKLPAPPSDRTADQSGDLQDQDRQP